MASHASTHPSNYQPTQQHAVNHPSTHPTAHPPTLPTTHPTLHPTTYPPTNRTTTTTRSRGGGYHHSTTRDPQRAPPSRIALSCCQGLFSVDCSGISEAEDRPQNDACASTVENSGNLQQARSTVYGGRVRREPPLRQSSRTGLRDARGST